MKKAIVLSLILLLLMSSFASAGFWDKITGKATATKEYSVTLCTDAAASYNSGDFSFLSDMEYLIVDHRESTAHRTDDNGIIYITWGSMTGMDRIMLLFAADKYKGTTAFENYKVGDNKRLSTFVDSDPSLNFIIKVNSIYNPANRRSGKPVVGRCADLVISKQVAAAPQPTAELKKPGLFSRVFKKKPAQEVSTKPGVPAVAEEKPAAGKPEAPTEAAEKTYKDTTWTCYDGSSGAEGYKNECMTLPQWQAKAKVVCDGKCNAQNTKCGVSSFTLGVECTAGSEATTAPSTGATAKCKTFIASTLSFNPEHVTGNQVCTKNSFGQCMVVLSEVTTSYSYDKMNVGLESRWSKFVDCSEDLVAIAGDWQELKAPWNMFDKPVYTRDTLNSIAGGSVLCCK